MMRVSLFKTVWCQVIHNLVFLSWSLIRPYDIHSIDTANEVSPPQEKKYPKSSLMDLDAMKLAFVFKTDIKTVQTVQ